jgi:hypothetical protein
MITVKEWMEIVNYRITEGGDFNWQCYGTNAYCLDSWDGEQEGHSLSIIFDQKNQVVYEVQIHDYKHSRAYRMIHPAYRTAFDDESKSKVSWMKEAWENVEYTDLDVDDDFIQKGLAVVAGEEYDNRIQVPLDLDEDTIFQMMKMAHDQDITLNKFVENLLRQYIAEAKVD